MASASTSGSMYECPICAEDFAEPKILPCAHRICKKCIVSWMEKENDTATCPMCRAPILSPTQQGQGDPTTQIDTLPTDFTIEAMVKSQHILLGPHVCIMCSESVTATSYCFECEAKLCETCSNYHGKLPGTAKHNLEEVSKLTANQLAANCRSTCKNHPDETAKVYCANHQELICTLCGTTNHNNCSDKKSTEDVKRQLQQRAHRLRVMEKDIGTQIKGIKDKFDAVRSQSKDTFDDLQQRMEKRRQEINQQIQAKEDSMTSLRELEKLKTTLAFNASSVEDLVNSAPEGAVMSMLNNLSSRLDDLESESKTTDRVEIADFIVDPHKLERLKTITATLGKVATPKPRRAELARVLKVGDGVKRGPDWNLDNDDGREPGMVIAIPSRRRAARGGNPRGTVDVRWANGVEHCYCMGADGLYDLDLQ